MTLAKNGLSPLAKGLEEAQNFQALWSAMVCYFHSAGAPSIIYAVYSRGTPGEVSVLLMDGVPEHVQQGFIDLGYARNDINFRYALATGQPSLRSETLRKTTMSTLEREHHIGRERLNYGDTLALPLYGPNNYVGIASLRLPGEVHASWTELHMAALAAHLKGYQLQSEPPLEAHTLSEREVEVLGWVAQGKSNTVIADILSIASGTVDTYLRRIFEKLNVADRTSAAVKGVSLGLIRI
jgi:DNA-binding CsgD family transcriptional regulator